MLIYHKLRSIHRGLDTSCEKIPKNYKVYAKRNLTNYYDPLTIYNCMLTTYFYTIIYYSTNILYANSLDF